MNKSIRRILVSGFTVQGAFISGAFGIEPADTVLDIPMDLPMDSVELFAINAQSTDINTNVRPEPLYKTPEASAFQEYGKFGTGGADGSVDISIPIHTISCRDLQIPITLHYGGGGIKVAQEASWVGLGWDLSVGGCINRVSAGQYDHLVRNAQWSDYLTVLNLNSAAVFQKEADATDYKVMSDLINGMGERDFYSVSLLGRNFLFFINPEDCKPKIIGSEDSDYSISSSGADCWEIKDVMGFIYEFSALEYSLTDGAGMQRSAWYLTSIDTPQGITATFTYETSYVRGIPQAYQWYDAYRSGYINTQVVGSPVSYSFPRFGSGASYSNTEIVKPWLSSITADNQKVTFETSVRTDFQGARKLDWIKVTDLKDTEVYLYHFNYGGFSSSTVGGSCPNILSHLVGDPRNSERLKLSSLSQMALDRKDSISHTFNYNEKHPLPLKTSAAVDFWGYYNGQENRSVNGHVSDTRSLIPSLRDCMIGYSLSIKPDETALAVKGACRFSDPERILSGTLSSITYPTGGKSVFTFEPHEFRSSPVYPLRNTGYQDIKAEAEDLNYPSTTQNPGPVTNRRIDIAGKTVAYVTVIFEARGGKKLRDLQLAKSSVTLQPMASPEYRKILITLDSCRSVNLEATCHTETFQVTLEPVPYMLIANLSSDIPYGGGWVKATLEFRKLESNLSSGGAGLRIASIASYDDDGMLVGRRQFEYKKSDGSTSGILMVNARATECRVKYLEHVFSHNQYGDIENAVKTSMNVVRINSSLNGGPAITGMVAGSTVGYTKVTEKESDGVGNLIRSTDREYRVSAFNEPIPDIHVPSASGNGEVTKETVFDASGNTLRTVDYEYAQMASSSVKCNMCVEDRYYEYGGNDVSHFARRYMIKVYPYITYWRAVTGIRTREYTPAGILDSKRTCRYNASNRLISGEDVISGETGTRTTYKYSVDYPSTLPYSRMIPSSYYIRGIPVETTSYELNGGTYTEARKEKLTYSFNGNKADMLHLTHVDESVAGGTLQARESFTYSDTDGTLVGTVKNTSDKRACLWSYAHTCPVAVIEGASYSEVESWVGAAFVKSLSAAKTGIESLLSQLRTKLNGKGVLLTTYTHKPLVGITSQTGPTGEKTTYEYDSFNRLSRVIDHNGKVLETYTYTYR